MSNLECSVAIQPLSITVTVASRRQLLPVPQTDGFRERKTACYSSNDQESAAASLNEPQQSKSWWRATDAPPPIGVYSGRFSPMVTLLSALFLTVALGSVVGLSASASKLDRIESPEQALSLMVSRTRDVQEGLMRAPQWEQQLFAWTSGERRSGTGA